MKQLFGTLFCMMFLIVNLLVLPTNAMSVIDNYDTYTNYKMGYRIAYPGDLLKPQGESDAGDGQIFLSKDKQIKLTVWGSILINPTLKGDYEEGLRSYVKDSKGKKQITYKVIKDDFYVISGIEGERIFYQKTVLDEDGERTRSYLIEYPKAQKDKFDPILKEIDKSFKEMPIE